MNRLKQKKIKNLHFFQDNIILLSNFLKSLDQFKSLSLPGVLRIQRESLQMRIVDNFVDYSFLSRV